MPLKTEIRRSKDPKGILVPLVQNFLTNSSCSIDSAEDVKFLAALTTLMAAREEARQEEGLGYYSPSSLGEHCLRKAYLQRHAERNPHGQSPHGMMAHYYFLTGNFIHIKWQFALYKLEKYIGNSAIFYVFGHEVPVSSKHGDHRGTIDNIVFIRDEPFVLDWKGLNYFSAKKVALGNIPITYRTQVVDYLVLWNSQKVKPFRIERALLMVEDKAGGENFLQEAAISLKDDGSRARRRLQKLREHEAKGQMPPPSCMSLKDRDFQGCQFRTICWSEVEKTGKARTAKIRAGLEAKANEPTTTDRVVKALKARSEK
jgi:hypothetical protein